MFSKIPFSLSGVTATSSAVVVSVIGGTVELTFSLTIRFIFSLTLPNCVESDILMLDITKTLILPLCFNLYLIHRLTSRRWSKIP